MRAGASASASSWIKWAWLRGSFVYIAEPLVLAIVCCSSCCSFDNVGIIISCLCSFVAMFCCAHGDCDVIIGGEVIEPFIQHLASLMQYVINIIAVDIAIATPNENELPRIDGSLTLQMVFILFKLFMVVVFIHVCFLLLLRRSGGRLFT